MRKAVLLAAVALLVVVTVLSYPGFVDKPVKDGEGEMAVRLAAGLPAPEYHSPLGWWQTHHPDVLNRGDIVQKDCLQCHEPQRSCNNCHRYVGVQEIELQPGTRIAERGNER